jgi:hypothetical protein
MKSFIASERYNIWHFSCDFYRSGGPNAVLLISFCFLLFSLFSCSPVYYAPGPHQLPAFTKKIETRVNAGFVGTHRSTGLEAFAAHTPAEHLTIAVGHTSYSGNKTSPLISTYGNGTLSELGLGYYLWPDKSRRFVFDHCVFLAYGNFAYRSSHTQYNTENYQLGSKFRRYSQVVGLTYKSKFFEAAVSLKLAYVHYYEAIKSRFCPPAYIEMLTRHPNHLMAEPSISLKAGLRNFKVYLSYEGSRNFSVSDFYQQKQKVALGLNVLF